jgi:predicted dehydrogenase
MKRIRVGLIGCGWISELAHIPNIAANPRAKVVAIADTEDAARARAMRKFPKAVAFRDADWLLADPDVEAVIIAVPPAHCARLALKAFELGKHVYLEKPGATDAAEMEAVRVAKEASGKKCCIGYNFRLHDAVKESLKLVKSSAIGELVGLQSVFSWRGRDAGGWRAETGSGGALVDLAGHHIDLVRHLTGLEIIACRASIRSIVNPDDTADLLLDLNAGVSASIHVSLSEGRNANSMRIFGREGHLEIDLTQPGKPRRLQGEPARSRLSRLRTGLGGLHPASVLASGAEPSFARLLDDFLGACAGDKQAGPGVDEALAVLRVFDTLRTRVEAKTGLATGAG